MLLDLFDLIAGRPGHYGYGPLYHDFFTMGFFSFSNSGELFRYNKEHPRYLSRFNAR